MEAVGPVAAGMVVVVCGVGLSVLAHGAKEQKLRQESEAREKAATEERTRLDKKQTERDERMWQEVGRGGGGRSGPDARAPVGRMGARVGGCLNLRALRA